MGYSACLATLIDDDCTSIYLFPNLSEYIKHVAFAFSNADNHAKQGSLQIKCNNLIAFLHSQIFVAVRYKTRTIYGHNH